VPGLCGNAVDRSAVDGCGRGVAGPERVAGHGDAGEPGSDGTLLDGPADRSGSDALAGGVVPVEDAREECAWSGRADLEPVVECPNRVGQPVFTSGDPDELAACILVGSWSVGC
jgi:hypothetical protein